MNKTVPYSQIKQGQAFIWKENTFLRIRSIVSPSSAVNLTTYTLWKFEHDELVQLIVDTLLIVETKGGNI